MSYKHFIDIQNLYETVSENDIQDQEFTKEIVTVISTSMFVEGYSTTAIEGYFQQSTSDEIAERYYQCLDEFSFIDDSLLTEDAEYEYVLTEESLEDLNEVIGGIVKGLATVGRKALAPAARLIGKNARKAIGYSKNISKGSAKSIGAVKDAATDTVTKVASKGKGFLGKVKDKIGKGANWVKDKVGKVAGWAKKNPGKAVLATVAPTAVAGHLIGKNQAKKEKAKKDAADAGKRAGLSFKDAIKASQTDAGKDLLKGVNAGAAAGKAASKVAEPPKPTNPSGKKLPTPKDVRPGSAKERMISKNIEIHGADKISKLRNKNAAFQATKDKTSGYTKDDFIKDFPNSQTAKKHRQNRPYGKRQNHPDLDKVLGRTKSENYDAFDIVLSYLKETQQADSIDEALYVMTEMDAQTIQGIVEDFKKKA